MTAVSRPDQRRGWELPIRLELAERDLDEHETTFAALEARLSKIMAVCVSILVALVTSSILLAVNLAVGA